MAKVKGMAATNYVGKLGPAIFYMHRGVNINRAISSEPSNPRTAGQMMQRVRLANLVNFYRANKEWMKKYAFETLTGLKTIYNEFVSQNLTNRSVPLTKQNAAEGAVAPDFLKVTKGSLPSIGALTFDEDGTQFISTLKLQADSNTLGKISADLIKDYGFRNGDQLSAIVIFYYQGKPCKVYTEELIINTEDTTSTYDIIYNSNGKLSLGIDGLPAFADSTRISACLVHSRRDNGKVLVSSEVLSLSPDAVTAQRNAGSKRAFELAIESYSYDEEPFLDPAQNALSEKHTISVVTSEEGTITGAGTYEYGTEVTISCAPAAGFQFNGWAPPFNGKPNPFTLQVVEDATVQAYYIQTE